MQTNGIYTTMNNTKQTITEAKIEQTTDYDIFKTVIGNREIYEPHLRRLISSIEQKNMLEQNPIIVNEKLEVIDGQHRLLAAKALGLPIYYSIVRNANLQEVQMLNANNRAWLTKDYLDSYIATGKKDYIQLKEFAEEWKISVPISIMLLTGKADAGRTGQDFKAGRFTIVDRQRAEKLASLLSQVRDHSPDRAFAHVKCVKALMILQEKVDPKLMTSKLEQYQQVITRRVSVNDYLREFENIIKAGGGNENIDLV